MQKVDWKILTGNVLSVLPTLPAESVHCVPTSPPYFGLRSYIDENSELKNQEIGIELNPEYVAMSEKRIADSVMPLFQTV